MHGAGRVKLKIDYHMTEVCSYVFQLFQASKGLQNLTKFGKEL